MGDLGQVAGPGRPRAARGTRRRAVILPSAWRSAEHDTAMATGQDAPWRGRRMTRTSWQKYLPPNWAPMPKPWVSASTSASSSRSRKPWPSGEPVGRQRVEVAGRGVLGRLQRELGRRAADDDGQVVRRAGGRAERAQLLVEEPQHRRAVQQRLGLLEQVALVGRAAALGHEQELVGVAAARRRARSGPGGWCRCSSRPTS